MAVLSLVLVGTADMPSSATTLPQQRPLPPAEASAGVTTTTDAPSFDLAHREDGPAPTAEPAPAAKPDSGNPINWPPPPGPPSTEAKETQGEPAPAPAPESEDPQKEATGEDWRESLGNSKITVIQVASYIGGAACEDIVDYTNTLSAFQNEFYAHLTSAAGIAKNNVAFISANCHTLSAEERGIMNIARRRGRSANDVSAITIEAVIDDENVDSSVNTLVTNAFTPATKVTVQDGSESTDIELIFGLVAGEVEESSELDLNGNFFNGIQDACEPYREAEAARVASGEAKLETGGNNGGKGGKGGNAAANGGKGDSGKGGKKEKKGKRGRSRRSRAASAMWTREADAAAERATRHISESRLSEASVEQSNYDRFRRMETALLDAQSRERRQESSGISECVDAAKEAKNFGFVSGYTPAYVDYTASSSSFVINGANVVQANNYQPPAANTVLNIGGTSNGGGGKGGKGEGGKGGKDGKGDGGKGGKGKGGKGKGGDGGGATSFEINRELDGKGGKGDKAGKDSGKKGGKGDKGPKTGKVMKSESAAENWSGHSGSGIVPAIAGVLVGVICTTLAISHYTKRNAKVGAGAVGTYAIATQEEVEEYVLPDDVQSGERSEYSPLIHI